MDMRIAPIFPRIAVCHTLEVLGLGYESVHQLLVNQYLRADVVNLLTANSPK
jgi:hypothetical protein